MPRSVELRQQRARVVESMRALNERAEGENRDLNAEEQQQYDRHRDDFNSLNSRIARAEELEQREAEESRPVGGAGGDPDGGAGGGRAGGEERSRQVRAAFANWLRRGRGGLSREERALVENAQGEILVPEDLEAEIIRSIPDLTVIRQLASRRPTSSNRVRRRSLAEVSVGWGKLETGTALNDSMPGNPDQDFTYIEDLYGLAKIGEDELDDTDVNLEAMVSDSFSRAIAEAEDTAGAVGTGHANQQPVGIFDPAGGVALFNAGQPAGITADDITRMPYQVKAQYRRNGVWLMASTTELAVALLKDANGQYLWQPSLQAGRPNTLRGFAVYNQEDIPAIGAAGAARRVASFGDVNAGYRLYDRRGMTVQRLNELYAEEGMVGFKARYRVGGDVIRPEALRILQVPA
ncbi:phage major capsid protein [Micromonospora aurantiaca]|uniref:phage major capsid protein n=1 Tax=Micromonospora aurantiaca (nom. illeg.) TaxID=47850 RepID=UPI0034128F2E